MRKYYRRDNLIYRWFRPLDRVTRAIGLKYKEGQIAHLDLVQEATSPTWTRLDRKKRVALRSRGLLFLRSQLEIFPIETVICDGRTVSDELDDLIGGVKMDEGKLSRITWHVGIGTLSSRTIYMAGWNIPLNRPTGLGSAGEEKLGRILASRLSVFRKI